MATSYYKIIQESKPLESFCLARAYVWFAESQIDHIHIISNFFLS